MTLSDEEHAAVVGLIPHGTPATEVQAVLEILSTVHSREGVRGGGGEGEEDDIIDGDQGLYDDGTETTRRQLLNACMALQVRSRIMVLYSWLEA